MLNEVYPNRYPEKAAVAGKTRAEVLEELAEAQRTGDLPSLFLSDKKLNEVYPNRYPQSLKQAARSSSRVQ